MLRTLPGIITCFLQAFSTKVQTRHFPLLSGELEECITPDDETCVGGMSSVAALQRYYANNSRSAESNESEPSILLPYIDKASPLVQIHPLQWALNRLVLGQQLF